MAVDLMTRHVVAFLAMAAVVGLVAAAFALGAASTRIPPTARVDTPDSLRPPVVQSEQKGKTAPVVGAVRVRVAGNCLTTGIVEAAANGWQPDATCETQP